MPVAECALEERIDEELARGGDAGANVLLSLIGQ
jgi:hypothetical protein